LPRSLAVDAASSLPGRFLLSSPACWLLGSSPDETLFTSPLSSVSSSSCVRNRWLIRTRAQHCETSTRERERERERARERARERIAVPGRAAVLFRAPPRPTPNCAPICASAAASSS